MDETLIAAEKEALIDVVKMTQRRRMKGDKGDWKKFLKSHDKKLGDSVHDPARRSLDDLLAFLKTFTKEEDLKLFEKVLQCHSKRKAVENMENSSTELESPHQRMVRLTLQHPEYPLCYSFPSFQKEWVVTKFPKMSKLTKSDAMFAVDCEMVLCQDGTEAVVKVCLVDSNLEVKLNELVKPNKPISDYRTEITGFCAEDLEGVTCSLSDVQKSMKRLLPNGAILVGHSLSNDLHALKLDHALVIDTCFIYNNVFGGITCKRPSLNELCKAVLGSEVRKEGAPHNCLDDALAAMKLVLAKLDEGLGDAINIVVKDVPETERAKLFIHRIPYHTPLEELRGIFPKEFTFVLQFTKRVRKPHCSAIAVFKDQHEANKAFESVEGKNVKDSFGKPQKIVSFVLSTGLTANVHVRKMGSDDGPGLEETTTSKKRSAQIESLEDSKKHKIGTVSCENHSKEIEGLKLEVTRLKQELQGRDKEMLSLQKIVTALTRKQGL